MQNYMRKDKKEELKLKEKMERINLDPPEDVKELPGMTHTEVDQLHEFVMRFWFMEIQDYHTIGKAISLEVEPSLLSYNYSG